MSVRFNNMLPGYHTAGLLLHDLSGAIEALAGLGFRAVAVRPQHGRLAQSDPWFGQQILRLADATSRHEMQLVLDLDTHFLHDAWKSRGPSLASADFSEARMAREWIKTWLKIAAESKACLVTFASGKSSQPTNANTESTLTRLANELDHLVNLATEQGVALALRPRSGDAVATVAQWERLKQWLKEDELGLAADIGEMLRGHELPLADRLERNQDALSCVYLCDRRAGQTDDLPIGTGDVAHDRLITGLIGIDFQGPAIIRIEGHSHHGLRLAEQGMQLFNQS